MDLNIFQGSPQLQTKIGLLMFMITWLVNCPTVVSAFLSNPSNAPYLTSQVTVHDSDESELIVQGQIMTRTFLRVTCALRVTSSLCVTCLFYGLRSLCLPARSLRRVQ